MNAANSRFDAEHLDVFAGISFRVQGELGKPPAQWVAELGIDGVPDAKSLRQHALNRRQVRAICQDTSKPVLFGYICAMAWGYQERGPRGSSGATKPWQNRNTLDDLEVIDAEVFPYLFAPEDSICVPKISSLPETVAKLMGGTRSIKLDGLSEISEAVALSLGCGKGSLSLRGIKAVSGKTLKAICQREGELDLGGLETLGPEQAEILREHKGGLKLNSLKEASSEVLMILAEVDQAKALEINSIRLIPNEVAGKLAARSGSLEVESIEELSADPGHIALANRIAQKSWVSLRHLTKLSPQAAQELALNKSVSLGLETLKPETAAAFSQYKGELSLRNLKEISMAAAGKMANAPCVRLDLGNVDSFPDDVFAAIVSNKKALYFSARTLTPAKIRAILQIPSIHIDELETISLECAKCLSGYTGQLRLQGLKSLTPDSAAELRKLGANLSTTYEGDRALATGLEDE